VIWSFHSGRNHAGSRNDTLSRWRHDDVPTHLQQNRGDA
jgi:hypothetical protein